MNDINLSEDQLEDFISNFLNVLGFLLSQEFAKGAPVDTGNLRNSIRYDVSGDTLTIKMSRHGLFVEFGTAPHIIKPINGKALKFKSGNKDVFAKEVHHPGTSPQPFIRPVLFNDFTALVNQAAEVALAEVSQ